MAFRRSRSTAREEGPPAASVDPAAVAPAYRQVVAGAVRAREQFGALVAATRPGPIQDRLNELAPGVDAGVMALWNAVQQATRLETVVGTLGPERVREELKQAKRAAVDGHGDQMALEALNARFASLQNLLNALDDLRRRMPLLEARLGTAVARAAELTLTSAGSGPNADMAALRSELDQVVLELEALRHGVEAAG